MCLRKDKSLWLCVLTVCKRDLWCGCVTSLLLPPPQAFTVVFHTAIKRAPTSEDVKERVNHLIDSITYSVFMYTARGLFERDKLTFIAQVAFQVRSSQLYT